MYKRVSAIYGVPRSGTSWLGTIFDSSQDVAFRFQPLFSYRFKNRISTNSSKQEIDIFFREMYNETADSFVNRILEKETGVIPDFKKNETPSLLLYKEVRYLYTIPILLNLYEHIKIIGIVRNPYSVLESWMNAPKEYKKQWNIKEEWQFASKKNQYLPENYYGYFKWKECLAMFYDMEQKFPDSFKIIRYEDLVEEPVTCTKELFVFTGLEYEQQVDDFIYASTHQTKGDAYSVYRSYNTERKFEQKLPEDIRILISKDLEGFETASYFGYI